MPHKIPEANINYKKGDRVQSIQDGRYGTVYQDMNTTYAGVVNVEWDNNKGVICGLASKHVRPAPWHGIGYVPLVIDIDSILKDYKLDEDVPFTDAGSLGGAVKAQPFLYKKGDRVKLKYNRNCGTIYADQNDSTDRTIQVIWDKTPGLAAIEEIKDLYTLHAPRDTDAVNPNQEAIDAIEKQRAVLKKEIEDLQSRLGTLSQAKRLLERG